MFPSSCTSPCTKWNRLRKDKCWDKFKHSLYPPEWLTPLDVPLVSSLLLLKRFYTSSKYFIFEFGDVFLAAFTSRDQSTNYKTCKHRYKLCHINQTGQSATWKKPVLNLKIMQIVGFEQKLTKFIEI